MFDNRSENEKETLRIRPEIHPYNFPQIGKIPLVQMLLQIHKLGMELLQLKKMEISSGKIFILSKNSFQKWFY